MFCSQVDRCSDKGKWQEMRERQTVFLIFEPLIMPEWVMVFSDTVKLKHTCRIQCSVTNVRSSGMCRLIAHVTMCQKCTVKDHGDTVCPHSVQCVSSSHKHAYIPLDCPIYVQEMAINRITVGKCLLFPEVWKVFFSLQPEQMEVIFFQATTSFPWTSIVSTQTMLPLHLRLMI
jgi:hypothetical protein